VLVSVAYLQDAIPLASQAGFGEVEGLLCGDGLRSVRATLGWARDALPSWLAGEPSLRRGSSTSSARR